MPWSCALILKAPETCRTQGWPLSLASPGCFLPLLYHLLSSLGDMSSVCPNSFHPRSALCQWDCLLCGEPANLFGSEQIVIYLEYEHLSEAADGGSKVELPEPRAGSVPFKCKARTIETQLARAHETSEEKQENKTGHLCAGFGRSQHSLTETLSASKTAFTPGWEGKPFTVAFLNISDFAKAE